MTDNTEALPPHPSHATVRDWMPVAEALRLADLWTVGDLDNSGQWRAAIKVLADEVRAALTAAPSAQAEPVAWQWRRLLGNPDVIEPFWTEWEFCSESQYQYALATPDHEARALCEAALPATQAARAEPKPCGQCRKADSWGIPLSKTCVYDCKFEPLNAAPPVAQAEPQEPLPEFLTTQDKADLLRIEDCFSDGEGYDLPRERMARLAELGVIRHNGGGVYSITAFGMYCTGAWPVLPLKTAAESNAEAGRLHAERMAHGIGKQEGK